MRAEYRAEEAERKKLEALAAAAEERLTANGELLALLGEERDLFKEITESAGKKSVREEYVFLQGEYEKNDSRELWLKRIIEEKLGGETSEEIDLGGLERLIGEEKRKNAERKRAAEAKLRLTAGARRRAFPPGIAEKQARSFARPRERAERAPREKTRGNGARNGRRRLENACGADGKRTFRTAEEEGRAARRRGGIARRNAGGRGAARGRAGGNRKFKKENFRKCRKKQGNFDKVWYNGKRYRIFHAHERGKEKERARGTRKLRARLRRFRREKAGNGA